MSDIDPIQYGALTAKVDSLEKKVDKLEEGMEKLLALANQSKGGFWVGMWIAGALGSLVTWASTWLFHKL